VATLSEGEKTQDDDLLSEEIEDLTDFGLRIALELEAAADIIVSVANTGIYGLDLDKELRLFRIRIIRFYRLDFYFYNN
jgi:hypothetical protein